MTVIEPISRHVSVSKQMSRFCSITSRAKIQSLSSNSASESIVHPERSGPALKCRFKSLIRVVHFMYSLTRGYEVARDTFAKLIPTDPRHYALQWEIHSASRLDRHEESRRTRKTRKFLRDLLIFALLQARGSWHSQVWYRVKKARASSSIMGSHQAAWMPDQIRTMRLRDAPRRTCRFMGRTCYMGYITWRRIIYIILYFPRMHALGLPSCGRSRAWLLLRCSCGVQPSTRVEADDRRSWVVRPLPAAAAPRAPAAAPAPAPAVLDRHRLDHRTWCARVFATAWVRCVMPSSWNCEMRCESLQWLEWLHWLTFVNPYIAPWGKHGGCRCDWCSDDAVSFHDTFWKFVENLRRKNPRDMPVTARR
jgi:hypothetical protein